MTGAEFTEDRIAEAMARAAKVACQPGDDCCYPFADRLVDARASCTPKGRCQIGWILANSGRASWDVWLDVHPSEGRLRRQANWPGLFMPFEENGVQAAVSLANHTTRLLGSSGNKAVRPSPASGGVVLFSKPGKCRADLIHRWS